MDTDAMIARWAEAGLGFHMDGAVAVLTLRRPEKRNAVTPPMRAAIIEAIAEVRDNPEIRAALVTGSGGAFCSGADLTAGEAWLGIAADRRRGAIGNVVREDGIRHGWWKVIKAIWDNEKPFVAAVNGVAYGFGCNYALACDIVIAAESAQFCEVFVKRGFPAEAGAAYLLSRYLSPPLAKEMALLGEPIDGTRAAAWGVANRCVPDQEVFAVAMDYARRLAALPTIGVGHVKNQVNEAYESTFEQSWKLEVTLMGLGIGDDGVEARAAFLERRSPEFKGR